MAGMEYNFVKNYAFIENLDYSGASIYTSYRINEKLCALARYDYLQKATNIDNGHYIITGIEYKLDNTFKCSINYRRNQHFDYNQIFINFGIKF